MTASSPADLPARYIQATVGYNLIYILGMNEMENGAPQVAINLKTGKFALFNDVSRAH